ncbi:MAG: hypothetical protein ACI4IL_00150 [Eubacterium sp.]
MKYKTTSIIMAVIGIVLIIICIATSITAINYGNELKELMQGYTSSGTQMTAAQEVLLNKIAQTKADFMKYLSVSLLTLLGTILDAAIIYLNTLKRTNEK